MSGTTGAEYPRQPRRTQEDFDDGRKASTRQEEEPLSRRPVESGISKWVYRHTSQEVCPWNVKFSRDATEAAFAAREVIAGKDARTLADEMLAMSQEEFRAVFKKSPIKRAKLAGLQRNAEW
jgi:epoxyqueuosine reductase QueG